MLVGCGSTAETTGPVSSGPAGSTTSGGSPAASAAAGEGSPSPVAANPSAWLRAPDIQQPEGFMTVHTDASGQPYTRGCAPCHPAVDTIMTDVVAGPAGLVAVGWVLQDFKGATWSSADGSTWSLNGVLPEQTMLTAIAANDSRYVAVGRDGAGATAWSSTDGRTWTRTASRAAFAASPLRVTAVAAANGGFVAGGFAGTEFFSANGAFWVSPDGLTWTRAPDSPTLHDLRVVAVTAGGPGFVAVSQAGPADEPGPVVILTSKDGLAWQRVADASMFHGSRVQSIAAVPGIGLVAVGQNLAGSIGVVWVSGDGLAWRQVPSAPVFGRPGIQLRMYDVTAGPHGAVVGGTLTEGIQYGVAAVWTSADGITWSRLPSGAEFQDTEINGAAAWGSRIVAVGDRGAPDAYQATAWLSPPDVGN